MGTLVVAAVETGGDFVSVRLPDPCASHPAANPTLTLIAIARMPEPSRRQFKSIARIIGYQFHLREHSAPTGQEAVPIARRCAYTAPDLMPSEAAETVAAMFGDT